MLVSSVFIENGTISCTSNSAINSPTNPGMLVIATGRRLQERLEARLEFRREQLSPYYGAGNDSARSFSGDASEMVAQLDGFIESYAPAQSDWTMQLWLDAWAEAARRPALQRVSRRLNREWQALVRTIVAGGAAAGTRHGSLEPMHTTGSIIIS